MASAIFKVGDLVQLKSGGPEMTVEHVQELSSGGFRVDCGWFAGKKREKASFPPDALKPVAESAPAGDVKK